jgi:isoleucyl-tRNA synthetase
MRFMYSRENPAYDLKFGYKSAQEIERKLLTLYNVFTFFNTYIDKKDFPKREVSSKNILDKWIISRLNNLIKKVDKNLDSYNPATAVLAIENFFIEDLSLWYVRRSRKRFHQGAELRQEAISTLYYTLLNLSKIIAPVMPFFSEEMYSNLKTSKMPESVHLCDWPKVGEIDNKLEDKMTEVRNIVSLALAKRADKGIKVRQPLAKLTIKNKLDKELLELIKQEVNVKEVVFGKELKLDTKITKELEKEGHYREMVRNVNKIRKEMGLTPKDLVVIESSFDIINKEEFKKEVGAKEFNFKKEVTGKEIKINNKTHNIKIKK